MAEPRAGDRFTCTVGVAKTHVGWFPTDLGSMKFFKILTFFEIFLTARGTQGNWGSGGFGGFEAVGDRVRRDYGGTARGASLYMYSGCRKNPFEMVSERSGIDENFQNFVICFFNS